MAGVAVRAAERGPARLARPSLTGPVVNRRIRPDSHTAPRPRAQSRPSEAATAAIITTAITGVGAVAMVRAARPAPAAIAPTVSRLKPARIEALLRNRAAGEVARALASGSREKAAAARKPNRAALARGKG